MSNLVLMSIKPEYAHKIFNGTKKVELRRSCPKIGSGSLIIVYVSSPDKAIKGAFEVAKVIDGPPKALWERVRRRAGVTKEEYDIYFSGAETAYAIHIKRTWVYENPIELDQLRIKWSKFNPPQSYRYFSNYDYEDLMINSKA